MHREIVILTVISEELKWAQKALKIRLKDRRKAEDGTIYWHGSVWSHIAKRNYSIALTCIGYAGNPICAAATAIAIREYRPQVVLLVGIAAGIRNKVKIGEVILSERVVAYESAVIEENEGIEKIIPRPDMPRIDHPMEQDIVNYLASIQLKQIESKFRSQALRGAYPTPVKDEDTDEFQNHVAVEARIKSATIASGEKLLRNPMVLYKLLENTHGRIEVGEMEAAGLATACGRAGVPWLVIRGISDFGDSFKDDRFHEFASKMAATTTHNFIAYGLDLPPEPPSSSSGGSEAISPEEGFHGRLSPHIMLRKRFAGLIEDRTRIFGGRETIRSEIVRALHTTAGGYIVVTAPAGFGKTALIASLVQSVDDVAYHFFTPITGTDTLYENFFLRNLIQQMMMWHRRIESLPTQVDELKALYHEMISEKTDVSRVVVIDGLDEVTQWSLAQYLNRRLPDKFHMILTVRDVGQDWAATYGLPADQTVHLPLNGLSRPELTDLMVSTFESLDGPTNTARLIDEVMRVAVFGSSSYSGADPLYVRLLIEDIQSGKLSIANLAEVPTGLYAYLDKWWEDIETAIEQDPDETIALRDLLGTLAVTLGPIHRVDLETMHSTLRRWSRKSFEQLVGQVRRYIYGDEDSGYSLFHPRMYDYLRSQIDSKKYEELILNYCALWSQHRSPYACSHYAEHLFRAGYYTEFHELLTATPEWLISKSVIHQGDASYLAELELALHFSQNDIIGVTQLCAARCIVHERVSAYKDSDLAALVQLGRKEEAIRHASLRRNNYSILRSPSKHSGYMSIYKAQEGSAKPDLQTLDIAFQASSLIEDISEQVRAVSEIVEMFLQADEHERAFHTARSCQNRYVQALCLLKAAKVLAPTQLSLADSLVTEALTLFSEITEMSSSLLSELNSLSIETLIAVGHTDQALVFARSFTDAGDAIRSLIEIANALESTDRSLAGEIVVEAFDIVPKLEEDWRQSSLLSLISGAFARIGKFDEALSTALAIPSGNGFRELTVSVIVGYMAEIGLFDPALEILNLIEYKGGFRASALSEIVVKLAENSQYEHALQVARGTNDWLAKVSVLMTMIKTTAELNKGETSRLFEETIAAAFQIPNIDDRSGILYQLAQVLFDCGNITRAVEIVNGIPATQMQSKGMAVFVIRLVEETKRIDDALEMALKIHGDRERIRTLKAVMEGYAETKQFKRILEVCFVDPSGWIQNQLRIAAAEVLAKALQFDQATAVARSITVGWARADALRAIVDVRIKHNDLMIASDLLNEALLADRDDKNGWMQAPAVKAAAEVALKHHGLEKAFSISAYMADDLRFSRSLFVSTLAEMLLKKNNFERVVEIIEYIDLIPLQVRQWVDVIKAQSEFDHSKADLLLSKALEVVRKVEPIGGISRRASYLALLARLSDKIKSDRGTMILTEAFETARAATNPKVRIDSMVAIAHMLATSAKDQSVQILDEALYSARQLNLRDRAEILLRIGEELIQLEAERGNQVIMEVWELLPEIETHDISRQSQWQQQVIKLIAGARAFDQALVMTSSIKDIGKGYAQSIVVQAMAEAGLLDEALDLSLDIDEIHSQTSALEVVAKSLAKRGDYNQALNASRCIAQPYNRVKALSAVIEVISKDSWLEADKLVDEALELTYQIKDAEAKWSSR